MGSTSPFLMVGSRTQPHTGFVSSFVRTSRPGMARLTTTRPMARFSMTMSVAKGQKTKAAVHSYRLAPSDFAFLWEECKRCFYLKAHKKLYRPRAPFPSIFGTIDLAMKLHLRGLPTNELLPEMSKGVFLCESEDAWVESKPITVLGHESSVFIRGMVRTSTLSTQLFSVY